MDHIPEEHDSKLFNVSKHDIKVDISLSLDKLVDEITLPTEYFPSTKAIGGRPLKENKVRGHHCDKCSRSFPSITELKSHKETHGEKHIKCQECDYKTKTKNCLSVHMKRVHLKKRVHSCQTCNKQFVSTPELKLHCQIHIKDRKRTSQCPICSYWALSEKSLMIHCERHLETKVTCSHCDQTFSDVSSLRSHIQTKHGNVKQRTFQCTLCPKVYKNRSHLNRHLQAHEGLSKFRCKICKLHSLCTSL